MNARPAHISGRPPLFTPEQVKAWRSEWQKRQDALRNTRTVEDMAEDAGITVSAMRQLLDGHTYQWVR